MIQFEDILADLELKRAAALPRGERPSIDVAGALGVEMPDVALQDAGPPTPLGAAHVAEMVADALAALSLAHGEAEANTAAARAIVASTTAAVAARLAGARSVTMHDLSSLVEAVLIEAGQFDIARALVLDRAPAARAPAAGAPRLIRRTGDVAAWDAWKIEVAIRTAFLSLEADPSPAAGLAARVDERARGLGLAYVPIETVQDIVQEELVLGGHMRVAERYILYRAERALLRARSEPAAAPAAEADDLRRRIAFASIGLDLDLGADELAQELRRSTHTGMHDDDLRRLVVLNAKALVERDSELSRFAGRILLTYVYEETLGWDVRRDDVAGLRDAHVRGLRPAFEHGAAIGRIDPRLLEYDLERLAAALDPSADLDFDFLGLQTLYDRYLICDKTGAATRRIEAPQVFWLRVAMGVCLAEPPEERTDRAIALYGMYKQRRFCSSTPTLFNAGTNHSQLSSCYLYYISDTLSSIVGRGIAENAMCSKWAGGLGGSWTAVRGTGSHIESTNGESQGVVPFLKMHNDQLVAVNQGGKRAGSGCAYLEVWHNDIREFLELRRNTGDERRRTHDMNTACWVPDLFMQRVEARADWTLLRSSDVPDLHDLYGREFATRYEEYEARVAAGEMHGEVVPALELWKAMLRMLFETGHPWITFKDACNVRSPQDHAGVVHSSNLCTEITLNTSEEETAVCNLGSIALDQHLTTDGDVDHARLRETVRIAVRALDDVIDVNFYPTEPARTANTRHRPVGLGVMGLQYALYAKGLAFASEEALRFGDEAMEAIAFYAYEASSDLAAERGAYASYSGSKWDRGLLPQDTVDLLAQERGEAVEVERGGALDWEPLRARIARQGMRNSNVLAIAPTATIANIMGTSPCIEPMYKNVFAKSNLSGDFMVLNPHLVADLKAAGLWSPEMASRLKAVDGDLEQISGMPAELVERYRTAFAIEPRWLIDAAARRAKWIDQSQSLNLFLAQPDLRAMSHMYRRAWRSGLKTTYYLRTLGASRVEGPTVARTARPPRHPRPTRSPARSKPRVTARNARPASNRRILRIRSAMRRRATHRHAGAGVGVSGLAARVERAAGAALGPAHVPGAALAVIDGGEVAWVGAVGDVSPDARFQAGSVSKALAAFGVLALAAETGTDLDAPLVPSLGGWRPPGAPPGMEDGITLRRVLSHTAGLSIPAYPGLAADGPMPDTSALLRGEGDAGPVRLVAPPGRSFRYSGGSFTVAQHWAELTSGLPFDELMEQTVLGPLGMAASTFAQEASAADAAPHDADGRPMPASRHAALAAAGLLTTAEDLGRFGTAIATGALPAGMTEPAPATGGRYGLGLELGALGPGLAGHSGQNRGWRALVAVRRDHGRGIVVLANGEGGDAVRSAALAELVA